MIYCTFDQYAAGGGALDAAAFEPLAARASRLIDRATFGRAERHAAKCPDCRDALGDACCQLVDAMAAAQSSAVPPGAVSVSNDGVSMSFSSGAMAERIAAEAQGILSACLGSDPHGLLYRGCG